MIIPLIQFLPIPLFIIYILSHRNRESISYKINLGLKCYSCKENLIELDEFYKKGEFNENSKSLCTSCDREQKLNTISTKFKFDKIKFHSFLMSKKYDKVSKIIIISSIVSILIDITFRNCFDIKIFVIFNPLLLTIHWTMLVAKFKLTTIKKVQ